MSHVGVWGPWVAFFAGVIALCVAGLLARSVLRADAGTPRMQEISDAIRVGSMAFLRVEYRSIAIFTVLLMLLFYFAGPAVDPENAQYWHASGTSFLGGAVLSALAGFIGMFVSTRANVRVAQAAASGVRPALSLAVRAGAVNGFAVVGLGLLGLAGFYLAWRALGVDEQHIPLLLVGFAFGGSLVSLFARVGGGIYTKAADVGTDLVGKIEAGIPEDDPRNPGVIADNVGDNVGDCAGMGADLFETYAVTLIGTMLVAASPRLAPDPTDRNILFPLLLGAVAVVASALGLLCVRLPKSGSIMGALHRATLVTCALAAVGFYIITVPVLELPLAFFGAAFVGLVITVVLIFITDYYTSQHFRPVRRIVGGSASGTATTMIEGMAIGLESVAIPVLTIAVGMVVAFLLGEAGGAGLGLFGVGLAAVGMLSVTGIVVALDTFGPVTDNAGGLAQMAGMSAEVRRVTDALDAVGNTTKATTKGYAIGSAGLASLVLFADFVDHANSVSETPLAFSVQNPALLAGMLVGAAAVFVFGAQAMIAVGHAAREVIEEVRRQFREKPGIMAGTEKPDYAHCVDIVTRRALREMILPTLMAVCLPLGIGFTLGAEALGGLLIGVIVSGLVTALFMANAGGAWDNAKKHIEDGAHGGKGSEAHKAAVVGDTLGDPLKDTAGPAINPFIKAITTIAVLIAALVARYHWLNLS
jgi:K(+)-stimulated pyrophosphate-energized sodium pump